MTSPSVPGKWRAAAVYTVLTLLLAYPISLRPDRIAWANDPDQHLVMWLLAWDTHAFLHHPLSIFDANTFYPEHRTLAYQENLIGSALFAAPVLWLTSNPVLAANVVSLLACVLCGLGAYVLARRVGLGEAGALLCGVIFAFSPPRFLRFPQTHLAVVQWIPFALASLHVYIEGGRRGDLLLAIAFFTLQVISSGHAGVFLVVAILLMLAYRFAFGEPLLLAKRARDIGVAGALLLVLPVLFVIPYRINQTQVGLRRSLGSWDNPIESFFASPTRVDVFLRSLFTSRDINGVATAWLFPGFLPVLLALAAIAAGFIAFARRVRRPTTRVAPGVRASVVGAAPHPAAVPVFVVAALSCALLTAGRPFLTAADGLSPQYYPDGRVTWTGYISIDRSGVYNFGLTSGATTRLFIDNHIVIDHQRDNPNSPVTGNIAVGEGPHRVLFEYVQTDRAPGLNLIWFRDGDGIGYRAVPDWALSRRPARSSMVMTARIADGVRLVTALVGGTILAYWIGIWLHKRREAWIEWGAPYRPSATAFYLLLTIVCIGLALGAPYGLWQFVYWLPGFNFIRGSSRFMVLGLLGIAMLAAIGFERLSAKLTPRARNVAAGILVALMAAEFAAQPFGTPYRFEIPAADQWVAKQPKPFVVAEVPSAGGYERYQTMYMLHSMAHWQKTIHGYGGIRPYVHSVLYQELDTFPDAQSLQHLVELDVMYVVVHIDLYPPTEWPRVDERLRAFSDRLTLEYSDPIGRVYAIRRPQETTRAS